MHTNVLKAWKKRDRKSRIVNLPKPFRFKEEEISSVLGILEKSLVNVSLPYSGRII